MTTGKLYRQTTAPEWDDVVYVATERDRIAKRQRRKNTYGCKKDSLEAHLEGALGEFIVADWTGEEWHRLYGRLYELDGTKKPDVGEDIHVRSTTWNNGRLILHDTDPGTHRGVLAVVSLRTRSGRIIGWRHIQPARKKEYKWTPEGEDRIAYFVPRRTMLSMDCFRRVVPLLPKATGLSGRNG